MSEQDLIDVTGKKRRRAQVAWFERHFGLTPVTRADGQIIITWSAFEGLQAKRAGIGLPGTGGGERPKLVSLRRAA